MHACLQVCISLSVSISISVSKIHTLPYIDRWMDGWMDTSCMYVCMYTDCPNMSELGVFRLAAVLRVQGLGFWSSSIEGPTGILALDSVGSQNLS